jgi:hypothetical protein
VRTFRALSVLAIETEANRMACLPVTGMLTENITDEKIDQTADLSAIGTWDHDTSPQDIPQNMSYAQDLDDDTVQGSDSEGATISRQNPLRTDSK